VGRPRGERPLVRLDRLNRGLRNLGLMQPTETCPAHVRKLVGRAVASPPAGLPRRSGSSVATD
jgi:hypothetical protein